MILSFKTIFPWGGLTHFVEKITRQPGYTPKIHSIRKGKRWKPGMKIHFATGVRTKNYKQFNFGLCTSTQDICIDFNYNPESNFPAVYIDNRKLLLNEVFILSENDGFDSIDDFIKWFKQAGSPDQIIHWTTKKY